ncbi:MAG: hypothetical protein WBE72_19965 [Terracidiphilus sp.]
MRSLRIHLPFGVLNLVVLCAAAIAAGSTSGEDISSLPNAIVQQTATGFVAELNHETVQVTVCSGSVLHIVASPGDVPAPGASPAQPWMLSDATACPGALFNFTQGAKSASLSTAKVVVTIDKNAGTFVFSTIEGDELLREGPKAPRTYEPVAFNGEFSASVRDAVRGALLS